MSNQNSYTFSNILLGFLGVVFVVLCVLLVMVLSEPDDNAVIDNNTSATVSDESSESDASGESDGQDSSEESSSQQELDIDLSSWELRLVNSKNRLEEDFSVETAQIKSEYCAYENMKFDARAIDSLHAMFDAAKEDGISLSVISSYRTVARQTSLYHNKVDYYLDRGYDQSDAEVEAATVVAIPGTSEHNLGLAVDINSVEETFEETKEFRWLQNNAEKYGFVLRYPKSKEEITGIIYEPWHYRYVGIDAAKQMNELDLCLEEYTEYLKNK